MVKLLSRNVTNARSGESRHLIGRSVIPRGGMTRHITLNAGLTFVATYGHIWYPAYLGLRSRGSSIVPPVPDQSPDVSIVIPAYRERSVIGGKLAELLATDYPGRREIIVVADDVETAEQARRTPGVTVLHSGQRQGKASAVNRGVAAARHEVVVLMDANTTLLPGSLPALTRHFADPSVGAVAGEKRVDDASGGEGFYWRFESWLKQRESALGTTVAVVGELFAVRAEAFVPLPQDTAVDDTWLALSIAEAGWRIVYEPQACTVEPATADASEEWERRTRIVAGNLEMFLRRPKLLVPGRSPVAGQIWGHRLVRSSFGPLAHAVLLLRALAAVRRSRVARLFVAGHLVAGQALYRQRAGQALSGPERLAAQVIYLQIVALGGVRRLAAGRSEALWPKQER